MRALTHTTYERTSFAFVFPAGPRLPLSVLDGRDFGLGQFCPRLLQGSPVVLDKSRSPSRSLCTGSTAESLCRPLSYSAKCQFLSCTPQQRAHVFALGHFLNTTDSLYHSNKVPTPLHVNTAARPRKAQHAIQRGHGGGRNQVPGTRRGRAPFSHRDAAYACNYTGAPRGHAVGSEDGHRKGLCNAFDFSGRLGRVLGDAYHEYLRAC